MFKKNQPFIFDIPFIKTLTETCFIVHIAVSRKRAFKVFRNLGLGTCVAFF